MRYYITNILYPMAEVLTHRSICTKLAEAHRFYDLPFAQRKHRNRHSLHALLKHAACHVPYYRRLFTEYHFTPDSVLENPSALEQLPFLTKKIIKEQGTELFDERYIPRCKRMTGASTGPATDIYYDQYALDWSSANNLLALEWAGKTLGKREVHISTRFAHSLSLDSSKEALKCFILNRQNFYTSQWDEATLEKLLRSLQLSKAFLVQGHPSTMYALAKFVEYFNASVRRPLFLIFESTGEKLETHQRKKIEKILGCTVFNRYGGAEFGVIAHETTTQRGSGCLKLMDHHIWAEHHPAGGGLNELVFTGLANYTMPLIRYTIGDLGTVIFEKDGPVLTKLEGRIHDLVNLRGKTYPTHYFQDILNRVGNVNDFQIITNEEGQLVELQLALENGNMRAHITRQLADEFGFHIPIKFCSLKDLQLMGWRNKFRYVISHSKRINTGSVEYLHTGKPKIAVVCHSLVLDGANNHLCELFKQFNGKCTFEVFSYSDGIMRGVFEALGITVHHLCSTDWNKSLLSQFDMVLGNTLLSSALLLKASEVGLPLVMTIHESWKPNCLQQHINAYEVENNLAESTVREVLQTCKMVIFPAAFQYNLYKPILSLLTKHKHIPCIVNSDGIKAYTGATCRQTVRKHFGFSESSTVFLQVGTLTPRKNQKGTVRAFAEIVKANPSADYHLVLLGARSLWAAEAAYLNKVQLEVKSLGIKDKVHIYDTTLLPFPFFYAADILVHPSYNEVLPLSLLEAAIFGIPIIASNRDGIPEIIKHKETGILVSPYDFREIAEGMQTLARNKELRRLYSETCRRSVMERHRPDIFTKEYEAVFGVQANTYKDIPIV